MTEVAKKETREERKARLQAEEAVQVELDLEQINELEIEFGDSNIAVLTVPFTQGLPARVAVRTPLPIEMKRFHSDGRKNMKGTSLDFASLVTANENLAHVCRVYPDKEAFTKLLEARPAILDLMGRAAQELSAASRERGGKD